MSFRDDFVWGAATSSYQIEGAAFEDGKGLNIWDVYTHQAGKTYEGHTGDVACDHYHRYQEDVGLMKEIGLNAYRFSLNWARILPEGTGRVNQAGLDFYDRLVDSLLSAGITPYMTLYHWELPYALHLKGGWLNPDIKNWFYEYAHIVGSHFSDRVSHFMTINEPQCIVGLGYQIGINAPGLKSGDKDLLQIWHNVLLAHGMGVKALRESARKEIQVGFAPTGGIYYPVSDKKEDIEAARTATFEGLEGRPSVSDLAFDVGFCCDPVYFGKYPKDILEKFEPLMPDIRDEDMALISQPLDFHGQNIYNAVPVKAGEDGRPVRLQRAPGFPRTGNNWPVTPKALYWGPKFITERYHVPFYITENGMSAHDWVSLDGQVHDPNRTDFLHRYLRELQQCATDGADIRGYFVWSLLDNYEWNEGYKERFGIIHVDLETQKRTLKDSAIFYQETIRQNGKNL